MFVDQWFSRKNIAKVIAAIFWLAVVAIYQWYAVTHDLTPLAMVREFLDFMRRPFVGPLIYIIFYILQPLIFFPSWLLTVSSGHLYGVFWGSAYTILASNLSSMLAYLVGYFFQQGIVDSLKEGSLLHNYAQRMRNHSFETVLVMRFMFLPYDIVSYLAGFLRIDWRGFLVATILGSIPGTLAFVSFGASMEWDQINDQIRPDMGLIGVSLALFGSSLLLWYLFKRYTR